MTIQLALLAWILDTSSINTSQCQGPSIAAMAIRRTLIAQSNPRSVVQNSTATLSETARAIEARTPSHDDPWLSSSPATPSDSCAPVCRSPTWSRPRASGPPSPGNSGLSGRSWSGAGTRTRQSAPGSTTSWPSSARAWSRGTGGPSSPPLQRACRTSSLQPSTLRWRSIQFQ